MSAPPAMTAKELRALGLRAWGHGYQARIARGLGVSDRTVRRWTAGDSAIPPATAAAIGALAERTAAARTFAATRLDALRAEAEAAGLDWLDVAAALAARAGVFAAIADRAARGPARLTPTHADRQ